MTRREEIVKATKECREDYVGLGRHLTSGDISDAFKEGAEWADKTMIEKACAFLFAKTKMSGSKIAAFRKAMEE